MAVGTDAYVWRTPEYHRKRFDNGTITPCRKLNTQTLCTQILRSRKLRVSASVRVPLLTPLQMFDVHDKNEVQGPRQYFTVLQGCILAKPAHSVVSIFCFFYKLESRSQPRR
ncbi:hypothetical protein EVAR_50892_1 [Eumeta japonica]|uniref:Uncharacterized protein n=1 Tax=Eumeta variegata TaxID=151549 RepID=A0A4C1YC12_EUMVA|nr:hypothetical protein EVAR_50892_1 [Eumeta japonica]